MLIEDAPAKADLHSPRTTTRLHRTPMIHTKSCIDTFRVSNTSVQFWCSYSRSSIGQTPFPPLPLFSPQVGQRTMDQLGTNAGNRYFGLSLQIRQAHYIIALAAFGVEWVYDSVPARERKFPLRTIILVECKTQIVILDSGISIDPLHRIDQPFRR